MKITLPDKPSELLKVALEDLEKCEAQPDKFKIYMWNWVSRNGHCTVCMAGAVAVQRMGMADDQEFIHWLDDQPKETRGKILAIDYLRTGELSIAIDQMGLPFPQNMDRWVPVRGYHPVPIAFKQDMRNLVTLLESHGL